MADHVLIDMPPSRAAGFAEMLFAAEWVLVPTQLERLSMEGVGLMAETVGAMQRERGRGPRLLGVVPNMARMVREHRVQLQQLVDAFGQAVWPPIPHSIQVAEASAYGDVLFDLAPSGKAAESMNVIVNRYLAAGKGRQ
jgi:chromosome partitioning protein